MRDPFGFLRVLVRLAQGALLLGALVDAIAFGANAADGDLESAVINGALAVVKVTIAASLPKALG